MQDKVEMTRYRCWLVCLALLVFQASFNDGMAQNSTTINRSHMIGIGGTNILDTYLSAEHFKGAGFTFLATAERQKAKSRWSTIIEHEANLSSTEDRTKTLQELEAAYNFYWGKLYGWQLYDNQLRLQVGGMANASLGVIYNTSNSNNPAQARAHLNLMPTGVATYRFLLFKKQFVARYELSLPFVGITFSPNYGQSYYEIFNRGNYDHNIVPTTFVSAPEWRHLLTLDAAISKKVTLRIGYLGNMQQLKVNGLRQHVYTHRFVIGLTKRFSIVQHAL